MKRRIYSETFVNRQIAKIDAMHEKNQVIVPYPEFLYNAYKPNAWQYQPTKCSPYELEQLKDYIQQWKDISYVSGFWAGYSLRTGIAMQEHDGGCTIYSSRINGNAYDGICTCGYGFERIQAGDYSRMLSNER